MTRKIGILPGTFDPVHAGHIDFALAALAACQLDRVVLLPETTPRDKTAVAGLAERVAMLKLAINVDSRLEVVVLKSSPFTAEQTLPELRQLYPGDELTLLLGSDVAYGLVQKWPGLEVLLKEMRLAVGLRIGDQKQEIEDILADLSQQWHLAPRNLCILSPRPQVASTKVRAGDHEITDLDPSVAAYITTHKLY